MVKMYWKLNKRTYYQLAILGLALAVFMYFLGRFIQDPAEQEVLFSGIVLVEKNMTGTIAVLLSGVILGAVGLAAILIELYLLMKPFVTKQLAQVVMMGQDVEKFIGIHIILVSGIGLAMNLGVGFVAKNQEKLAEIAISSLGYSAAVLLIPLLYCNSRLLPRKSDQIRKVAIVSFTLLVILLSLIIKLLPMIISLATAPEFANLVSPNSLEVASASKEVITYLEFPYERVTNNIGSLVSIVLASWAYYSLKVKNNFIIRL
ncbi:MAG: hypothetical protein ACRC6X_03690 [Culicoidibacterales bacterium]